MLADQITFCLIRNLQKVGRLCLAYKSKLMIVKASKRVIKALILSQALSRSWTRLIPTSYITNDRFFAYREREKSKIGASIRLLILLWNVPKSVHLVKCLMVCSSTCRLRKNTIARLYNFCRVWCVVWNPRSTIVYYHHSMYGRGYFISQPLPVWFRSCFKYSWEHNSLYFRQFVRQKSQT